MSTGNRIVRTIIDVGRGDQVSQAVLDTPAGEAFRVGLRGDRPDRLHHEGRDWTATGELRQTPAGLAHRYVPAAD